MLENLEIIVTGFLVVMLALAILWGSLFSGRKLFYPPGKEQLWHRRQGPCPEGTAACGGRLPGRRTTTSIWLQSQQP